MHNVAALYSAPDAPLVLARPLVLALAPAGFPSPADDHPDRDCDLHERLIPHPAVTYVVRPAGDSMPGAGLYDGDLLIVDRSLEPKHIDIVVAVLNGELTVKRLFRQGLLVQLRPANARYRPITVTSDQELLRGFPVIVADIGFTVEDQLFQVALVIQEGKLVYEIRSVGTPARCAALFTKYQCVCAQTSDISLVFQTLSGGLNKSRSWHLHNRQVTRHTMMLDLHKHDDTSDDVDAMPHCCGSSKEASPL
jgi:DNA polymerase V